MEGKKRRLSSVAAKTSGAPRKRSKTRSDEGGGLVIGNGHKRQTKVQRERSDIIKPKGAAKTKNLEADHVEEGEVFLVETPTTPHYDDAQSQNEFDSFKDSQNKSDQENEDENGTQNEREKDQSVMRDEAVDDNGIVGTQSEGDGGAGLYVFQCASCSTIVGDSLAMHAIDEELNTTTLRGTLSYMHLCFSPTFPVYLQWRRV